MKTLTKFEREVLNSLGEMKTDIAVIKTKHKFLKTWVTGISVFISGLMGMFFKQHS